MSQGSFNPKLGFLGQKVCHVVYTRSYTKVTTVCFQGFLQPIIKDRPYRFLTAAPTVLLHVQDTFLEHVRGLNCQ